MLKFYTFLLKALLNRCLPPPLVNNSLATFDEPSKTLHVVCLPGYRFPTGRQRKSIRCNNNGVWIDTFQNCESKIWLLLIIMLKLNKIIDLKLTVDIVYYECYNNPLTSFLSVGRGGGGGGSWQK